MAGALKISLALSGGAARGAFHLGVIAALERNNVEIAAVSGTSIGAVIAVSVGSRVSAFDMLRLFITPLKNKLKNQLAYRTFGCLKKLATF